MAQIGRKLYWDKLTGNVIVDVGEMEGDVRETTIEEDYQVYKALQERVPETVGCMKFQFGQYAQDFAECNGYKVNPDTQTLEFSYPDPNIPAPQEPVYQKPLSEKVADLEQAIAELSMMMAMATV